MYVYIYIHIYIYVYQTYIYIHTCVYIQNARLSFAAMLARSRASVLAFAARVA